MARKTNPTAGRRAPSGATPDIAVRLAAKAKDLEAFRNAVVDAASVSAGLWFSYLFVLLYLAIAVGGVTHRDLLLESPVRLPFLNVDLPLVAFFVLGPCLLLILHAYVLMHFVLLAGKVGAFHEQLRRQVVDEDVRAGLRRQLPSNIFVQILAGPREVRTGLMGFLLRRIAEITLVAAPLALLVLFVLQFLPYHHVYITYGQRIAVIADVVLIWTLWPSVARGERSWIAWRDFRNGKVAISMAASLTAVLLVFAVATFPGEWLDSNLPSVRLVPTKWPSLTSRAARPEAIDKAALRAEAESPSSETPGREAPYLINLIRSMEWTSLHKLLVGGDIDHVARRPTSLWSNRLVLPGIDVINQARFDTEAKIAATSETLSLRGRHLERAVLLDARMRKVDFTAAHLQGALLSGADLREAKFGCDQGVASFGPESFPRCAQLQGAALRGAQLQGTSFDRAQLQGAQLGRARLDGASLDRAQLQGAELSHAQLPGAILSGAQLQDADLEFTNLQSASFLAAGLQAATFTRAQLQGAIFDFADMQGASFHYADLRSASFANVFAWRTDLKDANVEGIRVVNPETGAKVQARRLPALVCPPIQSQCEWSKSSFSALKQFVEEQAGYASPRITGLDPTGRMTGEEQLATAWINLAKAPPSTNDHRTAAAKWWHRTACNASYRQYVIRGWLRNVLSEFRTAEGKLQRLAGDLLDEQHCLAARGLSEEDKAQLREIRDRASPAGP